MPPRPSPALLGLVLVAVLGVLSVVNAFLEDSRRTDGLPRGVEAPSAQPQVDAPPAGRDLDRTLTADGTPAIPGGRPAVPPTSPDENVGAYPPAVISPEYVSGEVLAEQVVIADVALPWRYLISEEALGLVDVSTITAAVEVWDGVTGSRWASAYAGPTSLGKRADGQSTIFVESSCADRNTANAYLYSNGGLGIDRYGTVINQILEADIGICPRVSDPSAIALAIRHEVGHVVGLAHLCNPTDSCWDQGMGAGPHECRLLFWQARSCQTELVDADRFSLRALYPGMRLLGGQTAEETAARTTFATAADGSQRTIVVLDEALLDDADGRAAATAGTALAARLGAPVLVGSPSTADCLDDPARNEVLRALARRGDLVLVGAWPAACAQMAFDWDVGIRTVDPTVAAPGALTASVELARLGGPSTRVVVLVDGTADPTATSLMAVAAATAGGMDGPAVRVGDAASVLPAIDALTASGLLSPAEVTLIADPVEAATSASAGPSTPGISVAGALDDVVRQLTERAMTVRRVDAGDPVGLAVALAPASGRMVLTTADDGIWTLSAAAAAVRTEAVLLVTADVVDPRVEAWITQQAANEGTVIAPFGALSPMTRAGYSALLG